MCEVVRCADPHIDTGIMVPLSITLWTVTSNHLPECGLSTFAVKFTVIFNVTRLSGNNFRKDNFLEP